LTWQTITLKPEDSNIICEVYSWLKLILSKLTITIEEGISLKGSQDYIEGFGDYCIAKPRRLSLVIISRIMDWDENPIIE
jgi:hypothetical protein